MFTGPEGPVEVFLYWPRANFVNFYWPGASSSPLVSTPAVARVIRKLALNDPLMLLLLLVRLKKNVWFLLPYPT